MSGSARNGRSSPIMRGHSRQRLLRLQARLDEAAQLGIQPWVGFDGGVGGEALVDGRFRPFR